MSLLWDTFCCPSGKLTGIEWCWLLQLVPCPPVVRTLGIGCCFCGGCGTSSCGGGSICILCTVSGSLFCSGMFLGRGSLVPVFPWGALGALVSGLVPSSARCLEDDLCLRLSLGWHGGSGVHDRSLLSSLSLDGDLVLLAPLSGGVGLTVLVCMKGIWYIYGSHVSLFLSLVSQWVRGFFVLFFTILVSV